MIRANDDATAATADDAGELATRETWPRRHPDGAETFGPFNAGQVDEVTAEAPPSIDVDRLTQIVLLAGVAAAALAAVVVLAKAVRA